MKIKLYKTAFTLAEVLITLGIIGVVASMTMPVIISNVKGDKLQAQFKKVYSELNQVALKFYADNEISFHEYTSSINDEYTTAALKVFMDYFKGPVATNMNMQTFDTKHNIVNKNLDNNTTTGYPCDRADVFMDSTGRLFSSDDNPNVYSEPLTVGPKICVDINGISKPNKWGVDRFVFIFTKQNSVVPYTGNYYASITNQGKLTEEEMAKYCSITTTNPVHTCAHFALQNRSPDGKGDYWHDFIRNK